MLSGQKRYMRICSPEFFKSAANQLLLSPSGTGEKLGKWRNNCPRFGGRTTIGEPATFKDGMDN